MKKKPKDSKIDNRKKIIDTKTNADKSTPRVLDRISKVKYYKFIEMKTIREIAKILKCNKNTVWHDLEKIKAEVLVIDNKEIFRWLSINRMYNMKELMALRIELDDGNPGENRIKQIIPQIKIFDLREQIPSRHVKDMQELGFVPKPEEHIVITEEDKQFYDNMKDLFEPARKELINYRKKSKNDKAKKGTV